MPKSTHKLSCVVNDSDPELFVGSNFSECVSALFAGMPDHEELGNEIEGTLEVLLKIVNDDRFGDELNEEEVAIHCSTCLDFVTVLEISYIREPEANGDA